MSGDIGEFQMSDVQHDHRTVEGMCGICPGACGVRIELVHGRIDQVKPLKNHPMGVVCVRGVHSKDVVYSEDRLTHPLRRTGERGAGTFERVSWDEALDDIAARMQELKARHGPQSMFIYSGRGMFETSINDAYAPPGAMTRSASTFLAPFGSPNTAGVNSVCFVSHGILAPVPTLGFDARGIGGDLRNANLIVVWGANPATDSPPNLMRQFVQARARGARVVVIDPRRTEVAERADQWLPIRSGTDGALAHSLLHVIINEGLYDRDFVERWTVGFEELRAYVQGFPPAVGERITGISRDTIVELARAIASPDRAALHMHTGLEYTNSGVQNIRAVYCLWAISGNLDVEGGLVIRPKVRAKFGRVTVEPARTAKAIGADRYPLFCDLVKAAQFMEAPRAILHNDPYPVRGMIVAGASILTSYPNPDVWRECLDSLDLLVVIDRFPTGDSKYADYVLPATTYYENLSYQRYGNGLVQLRLPVVEPVGEARSDYRILRGLSERLGYGDLYPQDEEGLIDTILGPAGISVESLRQRPEGVRLEMEPVAYRKWESGGLRPDGQPGFATPSGKLEIASSTLKSYGYDPLPRYTEPVEGPIGSPELARRFPLVLNTGARTQSAFRSQHLNIQGLLRLQPHPEVQLHPLDAAARGIVDGDKVDVTTVRGSVRFVARVSDRIASGQVEANMGGGSPMQSASWRNSNVNVLTDAENRDPISGFPVFKALLCEVAKASLPG